MLDFRDFEKLKTFSSTEKISFQRATRISHFGGQGKQWPRENAANREGGQVKSQTNHTLGSALQGILVTNTI